MSKSISCNVADTLYLKTTQREIGQSKGTPRALRNSRPLGSRALEALKALGHSKST